jgi:WD40 repeat protein
VARPEGVETRFAVLNEVNRQIVFICRDGGMRIHDLSDLQAPPNTVAHEEAAAIWSGAFARDGKTFFSGHQNGDVLVWDAATWKIQHNVSLGADWPVRELAASPDGTAFVAESQKELELWSLAGHEPKKMAGVGERYNFGEGLAFSPLGDTLATGGMFDILLFDAKTGERRRSMRHASYTMGLEFSPDGKRIASAPRGNVNKFLAVFDVAGDKPLFNAGAFDNYIVGLAFTPDGKRIAATGCERKLRLFDADSGKIILTLKRPDCASKPAFTRDGRLLGWTEPDGFWFIDLGMGAEEKRGD